MLCSKTLEVYYKKIGFYKITKKKILDEVSREKWTNDSKNIRSNRTNDMIVFNHMPNISFC